ncbi:hypothetical protein L3V82_04225 [Thiotrichales bacterium 19S3-7]|nr:hypothetical protein [Thiotrichales bacterium 19S3-7]MCF6802678.1 hypothetical protein [Thiotrichales bacterium 19S3-11]
MKRSIALVGLIIPIKVVLGATILITKIPAAPDATANIYLNNNKHFTGLLSNQINLPVDSHNSGTIDLTFSNHAQCSYQFNLISNQLSIKASGSKGISNCDQLYDVTPINSGNIEDIVIFMLHHNPIFKHTPKVLNYSIKDTQPFKHSITASETTNAVYTITADKNNTGDISDITAKLVQKAGMGKFVITNNCASKEVKPGKSCIVAIKFKPNGSDNEVDSGYLKINTESANAKQSATFNIKVSKNIPKQRLGLTLDNKQDYVYTGQTKKIASYTVTNSGKQNITRLEIKPSLTGQGTLSIGEKNSCSNISSNLPLKPNSSCSFNLYLKALNQEGTVIASVDLNDNFADHIHSKQLAVNIIQKNNIRNYSGYGVNFAPQYYYGNYSQASAHIEKMINILNQRKFALIQEMGTFADVGSNNSAQLQRTFINALKNAKNIHKVSFVIYSPYSNFWLNRSVSYLNPLTKEKYPNLCSGVHANIQGCKQFIEANILYWLSNNAYANDICNHGNQKISNNKNCQFIIGNERFVLSAKRDNNGHWLFIKAPGYNDFREMLTMPLIIDVMHKALSDLKYYNKVGNHIINVPVGINFSVATGTPTPSGSNAVGFKPVIMKSSNPIQYTIDYEDKKLVNTSQFDLCSAKETSVNGLINNNKEGYENLPSTWSSNAFSEYNQSELGFSVNTSLCSFFPKVVKWGISKQYLGKNHNQSYDEINILAAHVYPYFIQYTQNIPSLKVMMHAVYQSLQTYIQSNDSSYDLSKTFQLGETGYADIAEGRYGKPASVKNEIDYLNEVLTDFNKNSNVLSLLNNKQSNIIFWSAFDDAINGKYCNDENFNMGLFYTVFPACKHIKKECAGKDKSVICISN